MESQSDPVRFWPWMALAVNLALKNRDEAGLPIAALLVGSSGDLLAVGRNRRLQGGGFLAHAELDAIRSAELNGHEDLSAATLWTTHAPCMMCSGAVLHHRIPRVVFGSDLLGERAGDNGLELLARRGVVVSRCPGTDDLMMAFVAEEPGLSERLLDGMLILPTLSASDSIDNVYGRFISALATDRGTT